MSDLIPNKKATVIAVGNQKGGVGKTTTAVNTAFCMGHRGAKVLLVDMDPQQHIAFGMDLTHNPVTLHELLMGEEKVTRNCIQSVRNYELGLVDLLPSNANLSACEKDLPGKIAADQRLSKVLSQVTPEYDYVIIDCPPSLGILTLNALYAADTVLIPIEPSCLATHGLSRMLNLISEVEELYSKEFKIHGIITKHDLRGASTREIVEQLRQYYGDMILPKSIRKNVTLEEAMGCGEPIIDYAPRSRGGKDYDALATTLMALDQNGKQKEETQVEVNKKVKEEIKEEVKEEVLVSVTAHANTRLAS